MKSICLSLAVLCLLGSACHRSFDRNELSRVLGEDSVAGALDYSDEAIREMMERQPQLQCPPLLAVYIRDHGSGRWGNSESAMYAHEKEQIETALQPMIESGLLRGVAFIPAMLVNEGDYGGWGDRPPDPLIKRIRLAAARHGAEAVMVVDRVSRTVRSENFFSIFYVTIVGCWTIPGHTFDAYSLTQLALFDTANEFLYLTAEGEGSDTEYSSLFGGSDGAVAEKAADRQSFNSAFQEILPRLSGLCATAENREDME